MGLMEFLKRKKTEADAASGNDMITLGRCSGQCEGCSCGETSDFSSPQTTIRVLGPMGEASRALRHNAMEAVSRTGMDIVVEHITDMADIMPYGVMPLPALVINDRVVSTGRALTAEEIEALLEE